MKKSVIAVFVVLLLAVNQWGFTNPGSAVEWLLAANTNLNVIRLIVVGILLVYLLAPNFRHRMTGNILKSSGALLLIMTIGSALFIPHTDQLHISMYPLDFVSLTEAGILLILAGIKVAGAKAPRVSGGFWKIPALSNFKFARTV